jgi:hypothetical protein
MSVHHEKDERLMSRISDRRCVHLLRYYYFLPNEEFRTIMTLLHSQIMCHRMPTAWNLLCPCHRSMQMLLLVIFLFPAILTHSHLVHLILFVINLHLLHHSNESQLLRQTRQSKRVNFHSASVLKMYLTMILF